MLEIDWHEPAALLSQQSRLIKRICRHFLTRQSERHQVTGKAIATASQQALESFELGYAAQLQMQ